MTTTSIPSSASCGTHPPSNIQNIATAAVVAVSVVVMPVFTLFASSVILNSIGAASLRSGSEVSRENRKKAMICHSIALLAIGCAISISGLGFFTGAAAVLSIALLAKNVWDLHHLTR